MYMFHSLMLVVAEGFLVDIFPEKNVFPSQPEHPKDFVVAACAKEADISSSVVYTTSQISSGDANPLDVTLTRRMNERCPNCSPGRVENLLLFHVVSVVLATSMALQLSNDDISVMEDEGQCGKCDEVFPFVNILRCRQFPRITQGEAPCSLNECICWKRLKRKRLQVLYTSTQNVLRETIQEPVFRKI